MFSFLFLLHAYNILNIMENIERNIFANILL